MERLSDIRLFILVAQAGSFAAAARKAGVSAAVATRRIAALEDQLSVRLLHRTTRNVGLTEAGAVYLDSARAIVAAAEAAEAALDDLRGDPRGLLTVTASPTLERGLVDVVSGFLRACPDVRLKLWFTEERVNLVRDGFDLALRIGRPEDSTLIARPLIRSDSIVCASPAYLERAGLPRTPDALAGHQCLRLRSSLWRFSRGAREFAVPVGGALETNSGSSVFAACLAGLGITICPDWVVKRELATGQLVRILESYQVEPRGTELNAVYPARTYLPAKVGAFVDFLQEAYAGDAGA